MVQVKNNTKSIFEIPAKYEPSENELQNAIDNMTKIISRELGVDLVKAQRLGIGQNINFKLFTKNRKEPAYLVRIITRKGYPDIRQLDRCYQLLETVGINNYKILYYDTTGAIFPYGYFVQEWIVGKDADDGDDKWIRDFAAVLNKVHTIKLPYYGYLGDGVKFESLFDYYSNLDKIIDHSFGEDFSSIYSIWDLAKYEITSKDFLKKTFGQIRAMAKEIRSPVQSVLIHGDMLPQNLIYTKEGPRLIDWDEARASWWVYEIARTTFYIPSADLVRQFLEVYDHNTLTLEEIDIGIRLEHTRQLLRTLCMCGFNTEITEEERRKVRKIEDAIAIKLNNSFLKL